MKHAGFPLTLALVTALAACEPLPPAPGPDPIESCAAPRLQGLVNQPASVLETMRFTGPVRIIRPGMAVTMEYNGARLNFEIDGLDRIARVYCG